MFFLTIVHHYLLWHYSRAFYEMFRVWFNLIEFVVQFFSIPQLLRSWFAPWKRMTEGRGNKWDLEDLAGFIIIGLLSRVLGFIMRSVILLMGITSLLITTVGGFVVYAAWIAAPLLVFMLLALGVTLVLT